MPQRTLEEIARGHPDHLPAVAVHGSEIIGFASLHRHSREAAEPGVLVADGWQGGLGWRRVLAPLGHPFTGDLATVTGGVLDDHAAARGLLRTVAGGRDLGSRIPADAERILARWDVPGYREEMRHTFTCLVEEHGIDSSRFSPPHEPRAGETGPGGQPEGAA